MRFFSTAARIGLAVAVVVSLSVGLPAQAQDNPTGTGSIGTFSGRGLLPGTTGQFGIGNTTSVIQHGFSNQAIICRTRADCMGDRNATIVEQFGSGNSGGSFIAPGVIAPGATPEIQLQPLIIPEQAIHGLIGRSASQKLALPGKPGLPKHQQQEHDAAEETAAEEIAAEETEAEPVVETAPQPMPQLSPGDQILATINAANLVTADRFCGILVQVLGFQSETDPPCTPLAFQRSATFDYADGGDKIRIAVERTQHSPPTFRVYIAGSSELISGELNRAEVFDYQVHITFDGSGNTLYFAIPNLHDFYVSSRVPRVTGPRVHPVRGQRVEPLLESRIQQRMMLAYQSAIQSVIFEFSQ